ncbi:MAG: hypothetical protein ACYTBP_03300 [Planctomycetota bacterium]|jgi:hypothetical protein
MIRNLKFIIAALLVPCFTLLFSGCHLAGVLASPTVHEMKIPAEYDLTKDTDQKILVLVKQPGWVNASTNLRYYITEAMNYSLTENVKIPSENLVDYEKLSQVRSEKPELFMRGAAEAGKGMNVDKVLLIVVEDFQLRQAAGLDYYKGSLNTQAFLFDCATDQRIWPTRPKLSKPVRVGFEVGKGDAEAVVKRLATSLAYCTTRYFYDCRKDNFKIGDDRTEAAWNKWDK